MTDPRDLPGSRTDRMTDAPSVRHLRRERYLACDAPTCRASHWGHRLSTREPPWETGLLDAFGWWRSEHGGKGVGRAIITFEAPPGLEVPTPPTEVTLETFAILRLGVLPPDRPHPDVTLRPLRGDADWESLLALDTRVHGLEDADARAYVRWDRTARRQMIEDGRGVQLGAFDGDRLVGIAALLHDRREARFQMVGVESEFRRRGIATAMVRWLAERAREEAPRRPVWIGAELGGPPQSIYERLGFKTETLLSTWSLPAPTSP